MVNIQGAAREQWVRRDGSMKGGMLNDEGSGKSQEIVSVEVCS